MSEDDAAEDDWFERAVGDGESRPDADDETENSAADGDASVVDESTAETSENAVSAPDSDHAGETSTNDETPADDEIPASDETPADHETPADPFDAPDPDGNELDTAFEAATATASGGEVSQDPFVDDANEVDFGTDAAGQPDEEGETLFEDDFASAFGGGGESEAFDDEDFDSDIPRIDVGIGGLDRMIRGGVPERHLMVAIGSAGTGKTTFGLQYLNHGLENGENGVYITLEQSHASIVDTAAEHGWDFERYEAEDKLAVIDLDPIEMANSLDNIRGELPTLIEEFDADRFVLDSVSLLEMMYDDQARRRTEVFDFTRSLKRAGVTTLLTSEADEDNPYASRHGIIEYLTDAVFILQYVRAETQETRLAVEIQKIRNANHSRQTKPYEITDGGISVYEQANIF